jgi:hypothetical protein
MRKLMLALVAAIFVSAPAFAAVQNVKVSGDIDSWWVNRQDFNLGTKNLTGAGIAGVATGLASQNFFVTQTRIKVEADLSDNVSTTIRLLNETVWGNGNRNVSAGTGVASDVSVDQAFVTLREFLYSPLTVSVGRQSFVYGNGFILGGNGPNMVAVNTGLNSIANDLSKDNTNNDGVKLVFDYKPLTLDVIYYKNNQRLYTGAEAADKTGSNVYGLNANYQLGDEMNTVVEGYFFARTDDSNLTTTATDKGDKLYVPGLRVSTNPVKGLTTQAEVAWQLGTKAVVAGGAEQAVHRNAFAYQVMANYAIDNADVAKYKPSVNASFTHTSGDKNSGANSSSDNVKSAKKFTAWDTFAEGQNGGTIYNSLFALSNLNIVSVGGQVTPIEDVTASFAWSNLFADKKYRGGNALSFSQPDGSTSSPATTGRKDLGNEYDVNVDYAYTEDVTLGVSLGWFVPGSAFTSANDTTASQALAHVNVNF